MPHARPHTLGHLDLDHRLSRRHRQQVREVGPSWEVGPRGDTLAPADAAPALEVVVADVRRVMSTVLGPCGVTASGLVVVEAADGLVAIRASGHRVTTRRLGPGPRDRWSPSVPPVEECRILRLDAPRPRTADRGDPWPC